MYRVKVVLDTQKDIRDFVGMSGAIIGPVFLEDGTGLRVNAKSLMGVMYGIAEFKELYVMSDDVAVTSKFNKFVV